jgi:homoserine kinase
MCKKIIITEFADYPSLDGLFYEHKGDVVALHHDNVEPSMLGWFKVWYDSEMNDREYITINNEILYLDSIDEL